MRYLMLALDPDRMEQCRDLGKSFIECLGSLFGLF